MRRSLAMNPAAKRTVLILFALAAAFYFGFIALSVTAS